MMAVEEFNDMEAAPVHIEMDVPLFEVGCYGFPNLHFGMQLFHLAPGSISDSLAVNTR